MDEEMRNQEISENSVNDIEQAAAAAANEAEAKAQE